MTQSPGLLLATGCAEQSFDNSLSEFQKL